jgi:hypothetical protein
MMESVDRGVTITNLRLGCRCRSGGRSQFVMRIVVFEDNEAVPDFGLAVSLIQTVVAIKVMITACRCLNAFSLIANNATWAVFVGLCIGMFHGDGGSSLKSKLFRDPVLIVGNPGVDSWIFGSSTSNTMRNNAAKVPIAQSLI